MTNKTPKETLVYQNTYRQKRRAEIITYLGGKCVQCESIDDLQIDHIKAVDKHFDIGRNLGMNKEKLWQEVAKCQLLCASCHSYKSVEDHGHTHRQGTHGTASAAKLCKPICELCKEARRIAQVRWRASKRTTPSKPHNTAVHGASVMYTYHKCRCDVCKTAQYQRNYAYRQRKNKVE